MNITNMAATVTSTSASSEAETETWPLLPVETEIYILPDGRVIVADLPAELASLLAALGVTVPDEVTTLTEPFPAHE
ncbi:MAG: hypothetical protein ACOYNY_25425 [Caldilineaceae bacterium]